MRVPTIGGYPYSSSSYARSPAGYRSMGAEPWEEGSSQDINVQAKDSVDAVLKKDGTTWDSLFALMQDAFTTSGGVQGVIDLINKRKATGSADVNAVYEKALRAVLETGSVSAGKSKLEKQWYTNPTAWIGIGGGALVLIVLAVVLTKKRR